MFRSLGAGEFPLLEHPAFRTWPAGILPRSDRHRAGSAASVWRHVSYADRASAIPGGVLGRGEHGTDAAMWPCAFFLGDRGGSLELRHVAADMVAESDADLFAPGVLRLARSGRCDHGIRNHTAQPPA